MAGVINPPRRSKKPKQQGGVVSTQMVCRPLSGVSAPELTSEVVRFAQNDSLDDECMGPISVRLGYTASHLLAEAFDMIELKRIWAVTAAAVLLTGPASVGATSGAASASATGNAAAVVGRGFGVSVVDPACKPVFDAMHKTLDTPNHMYTDRPDGHGKRATAEMITINGDRYIKVNEKWTKSRMTVAATREQEEENIKNAKALSCKKTGDDSVNGEAATVYTEHSENEDTKSDGKIWVSKSRGVILKEEIDLDTGGGDKEHVALRYEYGGVKAPI